MTRLSEVFIIKEAPGPVDPKIRSAADEAIKAAQKIADNIKKTVEDALNGNLKGIEHAAYSGNDSKDWSEYLDWDNELASAVEKLNDLLQPPDEGPEEPE